MSFCKKTRLPSFLSFTSISVSDTSTSSSISHTPQHKCCHPASLSIGLATATGDTCRPPNVLESATVGPPQPQPVPLPSPSPFHSVFADGYGLRKEGEGVLTVGFFEEVGEVVDGLMSCTESLGFESSDERRVDEGVPELGKHGGSGGGGGDSNGRSCALSRAKRREESERLRGRKFPPPITSLNDKGWRSFFLRAHRRDGRLELAEVRIDRPEILRASRVDGRLRLELIEEEEEQEEDELEGDEITEEEEQQVVEGEETEEEWKVPVAGGGGEGFGRCHEMVGHGHHHQGDHLHHNDLHVWRQHCVTIR